MSYEPTVWVDGDHVTSAKLNKLEQGVNSMGYVPTIWNAGDVVTAEKLNKLEQGVASSGGGGGDDGFTTAEVTVSFMHGQNSPTLFLANVVDDGEIVGTATAIAEAGTYVVILKDGVAYGTAVVYDGELTADISVVSGDAEADGTDVAVFGDCELHINVINITT